MTNTSRTTLVSKKNKKKCRTTRASPFGVQWFRQKDQGRGKQMPNIMAGYALAYSLPGTIIALLALEACNRVLWGRCQSYYDI